MILVALTFDTLRVTGPDRQSWLNGLLTCNLAASKVGDAVLGLSVQKSGKIESEVIVLLGAEDILLGVAAGTGEPLREKLDKHLIMEDAEISLVTPGPAWTLAIGDGAPALLESERAAGPRGGLYSRAGLDVAALVSSEPRKDVANEKEWASFRVLHGIAERGVDYGAENYPQEAALERDAVSFEKGCYLGQEAVFMLEKRGHVQKRLVQLEASEPLERGAQITEPEGKPIGEITTSVDRLALGYVKYKHARDGREVLVAGKPARVTALLALREE